MNIDFENSFLYFYSTIPQVLGALIALFGVFLLFKFQSLNNSIISFGKQISERLDNENFLNTIEDRHLRLLKGNLKEGIIRQDIETVASQIAGINKILEDINFKTNFINDTDAELMAEKQGLIKTFRIYENIQCNCLEIKNNLLLDAKSLLIQSSLLILISILCIPFVHVLLCSNNLLILIIISTLILLWTSKCLIKLVWLIIISLSHDYNDEKMPNKKGLYYEIFQLFKKKTVENLKDSGKSKK